MPVYQNSKTILTQIEPSNDVVSIYTPSLVGKTGVPSNQRFTGFITDLRLKSVVNSLPETPLPEFELGQSKTAKMAVVRDLEYNSPRYELELFLRTGSIPWLSIFSFAIHARKPFFVTEILGYLTTQPAFTVSPDASLGAKINDVGWGLPDSTDSLVLYGNVTEEFSTPTPPIIQYFNSGGTTDAIIPPEIPIEDDIDMATLTPVTIELNLSNPDWESSGYLNTESVIRTNPAAQLTVWESLKLAKLDLFVSGSYSRETTLLTVPSQYLPVGLAGFSPYSVDTDSVSGGFWAELDSSGNLKILRAHNYSWTGYVPLIAGSLYYRFI